MKPLTMADIRTKRWTKAGNGRLLPLNSEAWHKLRRSVLAEEPLCRMCSQQGRNVAATDVDHINNDPSNNSRDNLQGLCHECHSRKTNADMGHVVRWGCAADGTPLDPSHPWNQKSPATEGAKPAGSSSSNAYCLKNRQS